jgi:protein PhnA
MLVCPECGHEWLVNAEENAEKDAFIVRDSNGAVLSNGDTVVMIKDLKVKGSSSILKIGTKIKNIRLVESDHNIDCKVKGIGAIALKSEFVKKG